LVTGAAGFVGQHLTSALAADGVSVAALDLPNPLSLAAKSLPPGVTTVPMNLTAGGLVGLLRDLRPDFIFHLAGHASVPDSIENPRTDFELNALATFEILEAMRASAVSAALINASSAAVYGVGGSILHEDQEPVPTSPYGASKRTTEIYLRTYCTAYRLKGASVRVFSLYGPGLRRHVVYDLLEKFRLSPNAVQLVGDGNQVRDFIYISDCVSALKLIAARGALRGEVYNVAGGSPVTINQLALELARVLGISPTLTFSGAYREGTIDRWVADCERLRAIGFVPQVDLVEGLRRTAEWFAEECNDRSASQRGGLPHA
jgi:UDP-glucose 4-epimerase